MTMRACASIVIRQICSAVDVRGGSTSIPIAHLLPISLACNYQSGASGPFLLLLGVYVPFTHRRLVVPSRYRVGLTNVEFIPHSISSPSLLRLETILPRGSAYRSLSRPTPTLMQKGMSHKLPTSELLYKPCVCIERKLKFFL